LAASALATLIIVPSPVVREGFTEAAFGELVPGDIVQFPRYGFVRVDSPESASWSSPRLLVSSKGVF
jgi:hypothetical protein